MAGVVPDELAARWRVIRALDPQMRKTLKAVHDMERLVARADVVICAHHGLDGFASIGDLHVKEGQPNNFREVFAEVSKKAEALVLCFPVWNFGFPAILKGYFDRVFLPGVSFELVDGKVYPSLKNLRRIAAVTTYGGSRLRAILMGDPPRKLIKRLMR